MNTFNVNLYQDFLKNYLREDANFLRFNELLIKAGAVISGSSLVKIYSNSDFEINDIDIYLKPSNYAIELKEFLEGLRYYNFHTYSTPGYDNSFMLKNNILAVSKFYYNPYNIDFIFVSPNFDITNVVSNFDLTFCQIWYDGNSIHATHPNDIISKSGKLNPEYISSFLKLNKFTINRIKKYRNRGFKILIDIPKEICDCDNTILLYEKEKKNVSEPLKWFILYIYNLILYYRQSEYDSDPFKRICKKPLSEYNLVHLNTIVNFFCENTEMDNSFIKDNYISILKDRMDDKYLWFTPKFKNYIFQITGITEEDILGNEDSENNEYNEVEYNEDIEDEDNEIEPALLESINVNEQNLGNTCNDLVMLTEENIDEYLSNEGNLMFISRGLNNNFDMICFERDMIENIYNDKNSNWFYECNGPIIEGTNDRRIADPVNGNLFINTTPYVKIPIDTSGMNGFISAREILSLLNSSKKAYYLEPALDEDGNQKMFTHTISHNNAYGTNPNWVSANHCQSGSIILIYTLKVCRNPETCIRSIVFNNDGEEEVESENEEIEMSPIPQNYEDESDLDDDLDSVRRRLF